MARVLEFDYETAVDQATQLFWEKGYAGTSLRDLLKGMGIGESSFYNSLKSKKNAYLECLKHYNATVNRRRAEAVFEAPTFALGIRALFRMVLDCLDDPTTPSLVCLMAGSLTHEVLDEAELRAYVEGQMVLLSEALVARMSADRQAGLLGEEVDPQVVAPVIVTYLQGIWRMALVSYERARLERQIEFFLRGLGV